MLKRYEIMLAGRYLRSKRDERFVSLIGWSSAVGMTIGVAALITVLSVMYGFDTEFKNKILGFSSHIDIQGPNDTLSGWQQWMRKVEGISGVERVGPYISTQILASYAKRSTGAILKGIDPNREGSVTDHIIAGRFLTMDPNASPFEVVVGKTFARKLGLMLGDQVKVLSPSGGVSPIGMTPRMRAFKLVGIFDSGFYEYDSGLILAPLSAVQRLNRLDGRVTGIEVYLEDRNMASEMARVIRAELPLQAWVNDWTRRHRSLFEALKMERVAMGVILSLIVIVAVFNMVVSLVMVVMERRKEIAILKTIGATHGSVMRIFLMMGMFLSTLGTLVGTGLGLLLAWKLDVLLRWVEQLTGVTFLSGDVYHIDHVPSIIDPPSVLLIVIMSLLMGLIATLYPAWRAAGIPPAEALRYE